jgi:hypothetical protein
VGFPNYFNAPLASCYQLEDISTLGNIVDVLSIAHFAGNVAQLFEKCDDFFIIQHKVNEEYDEYENCSDILAFGNLLVDWEEVDVMVILWELLVNHRPSKLSLIDFVIAVEDKI